MKKNPLLIIAIVAFIFSACKKDNDTRLKATADLQLEQLIAKYPNLKIISKSGANNDVLTENELKALDDSLAMFSSLAKGIHVVPNTLSTTIKKVSTESLKTNSTLKTNDDDATTGYGSYIWTTKQQVGSSELGYYNVSYVATFQYYSKISRVNVISAIGDQRSIPTNGTYSEPGGPFYYYTYNFSYTPLNTASALTNNAQTASLSYSGQVSLTKTKISVGNQSIVVSSTSNVLTLNTQVWSSTFPWIYPN
ncbi:hypothetical protein [Mucilaginibacter sp. KACC 22063]|uniref:hypothetical protein n=1 Tax=Mucilaginibacter sp. KACC 22063 TaxID=3025666 RepID=UPI0023655069|nr:hypothetical protein [Mucilaginibacter sp. KACC 22063]WDF55813.1 hypothetical protein PQ461_01900 [Mucilaginibacter sp. KACC 22063]